MALFPANSVGDGLQLKNYQDYQSKSVASGGYGVFTFDYSSLGLSNNSQVKMVQAYTDPIHVLQGGIQAVNYLNTIVTYLNTSASTQTVTCTLSVLYTK